MSRRVKRDLERLLAEVFATYDTAVGVAISLEYQSVAADLREARATLERFVPYVELEQRQRHLVLYQQLLVRLLATVEDP